MSERFEGGCCCKAVRYRLTSAPMFVHCCHCLNCQSQTGSAFVINAIIETERIETEAREKREEEARIARERQARAEELNNMGRDAFGNQGVGETEGSEGITQGSGNQGDPNGSPDAENYGTGGGLGVNFGGLGKGRGKLSLPLPDMAGCDITQKIEVKVEIQVDRDGRVVGASVLTATYQNKCIWDMVVEAAKKSRFTADQSTTLRETGWIRYIIEP